MAGPVRGVPTLRQAPGPPAGIYATIPSWRPLRRNAACSRAASTAPASSSGSSVNDGRSTCHSAQLRAARQNGEAGDSLRNDRQHQYRRGRPDRARPTAAAAPDAGGRSGGQDDWCPAGSRPRALQQPVSLLVRPLYDPLLLLHCTPSPLLLRQIAGTHGLLIAEVRQHPRDRLRRGEGLRLPGTSGPDGDHELRQIVCLRIDGGRWCMFHYSWADLSQDSARQARGWRTLEVVPLATGVAIPSCGTHAQTR